MLPYLAFYDHRDIGPAYAEHFRKIAVAYSRSRKLAYLQYMRFLKLRLRVIFTLLVTMPRSLLFGTISHVMCLCAQHKMTTHNKHLPAYDILTNRLIAYTAHYIARVGNVFSIGWVWRFSSSKYPCNNVCSRAFVQTTGSNTAVPITLQCGRPKPTFGFQIAGDLSPEAVLKRPQDSSRIYFVCHRLGRILSVISTPLLAPTMQGRFTFYTNRYPEA